MNDPFNEYGLKTSVLVAGFAGGILRALSHKKSSLKETIASPICGALAAGYLTGPIVHYLQVMNFPLPPDDGTDVGLHASAFVVGVCGMWVSDAIFQVINVRLHKRR